MPDWEVSERTGTTVRPYGTTRLGEEVRAFTLAGENGMRVEILEYGAVVARLVVPDAEGRRRNVVLGYPSLAGYQDDRAYFGAIVGRWANRIRGGTFEIDGVRHQVAQNQPPHHLHGGVRGFDKRVWLGEAGGDAGEPFVTLRRTSPDGEEGFPGSLEAVVRYTLVRRSVLRIEIRATTDAPTIVSLATHGYFNLRGEGSGTVCDHVLTVDADAYTPVDEVLIPTGIVGPVTGTPFDLRRGARIGDAVRSDDPQIAHAGGIDHNFVLRQGRGAEPTRPPSGGPPDPPGSEPNRGGRGGPHGAPGPATYPRAESPNAARPPSPPQDLRRAARLVDPASGRTLELHTDQPGLQVYTGNFLTGSVIGTGGRRYRQGDGIALEPQNFPDAPNVEGFPNAVLRPGETYVSTSELRFGVESSE